MKTLKKIIEENTITGFTLINNVLIGAVTETNGTITLNGDTSNIPSGTPVTTKTEFTVVDETLTIDGVDYNTLTVREVVSGQIGGTEYDIETITPAQGMVQLDNLGLLESVENMIVNSNDTKLNIFWERSVFWEKKSPVIQNMSAQLGIDLDLFFYDASLIEI